MSSFGDQLVPVALAFAVLDLTGSVTDLGLVLAAQTVPLAIFVLFGMTAVLLLTGSPRVWQLAALQAVYGTAEAFFGPASTALVPQTVAESELQQANALLGLSGNVASVMGPAVAGVIVVTIGAGWGLAVDAATFIASALFLSQLRITGQPVRVRSSTWHELRAGWHAFRSRTWLWVTVLYFTVFLAAVFGPLQVLGPAVARRSLGGAGAWAAISAALGVGSVFGGLLGLRWRPRYPLRAAFIGFLIATPALVAAIAAHAPVPIIVAVALIDGGTGTFFNTIWFTALQRAVPQAELSRVSSWDYLGSIVLLPLGQAASGPIAATIGLSTTLFAAAGLAILMLLAVLAVPAVRNFSQPSPPQAA